MKKIKLYTVILAAIMMLSVFAGCGKNVKTLTEDQVKFADPITENILVALKDGDYAKFSENFDDAMKKALDEKAFKQTRDMILPKIGDYVSKEFTTAQSDNKYTVVIYKAKYTKEAEGVKITMSFTQKDGKYLVSGFLMDSPNLRKK